MKKLIKINKRGIIAMTQAFMFDLLFAAVLMISILSFVKVVDDGVYIWRRYYAEDIALTLNIMEGLNEDISVMYDAKHDKFLGGEVKLVMDINNGRVSIFSPVHPATKTMTQFMTKRNKAISIFAPLREFTISNENKNTDLKLIDRSCDKYSINEQNYVETSIEFNEANSNEQKDIVNKLINLLKQKVEDTYNGKLSSTPELVNILYSKNIENIDTYPYIDVKIGISNNILNKKKMIIYYSNKGLSRLSETLACILRNKLVQAYGQEYSINMEGSYNLLTASSNSCTIELNIQTNELNMFGGLNSQTTTTEANAFVEIIHNSILTISKDLSKEDLDRLKLENGIE